MSPGNVMAATRGAAKEAMVKEAVLKMTEITTSQPGVTEGYTLDPELLRS